MKDDIANEHTTTDPCIQINHDCVENNNDVDHMHKFCIKTLLLS